MTREDIGDPIPDIYEMVAVEEIHPLVYRGRALPGPYGRIFGGQLIGQSVMAATHTVVDDRPAHSFRCSFLRMGDIAAPIDYHVEIIRDGRAVSVREVRASQDGRVLLIATVSFHNERGGVAHQLDPGDYPSPDDPELEPAVLSDDRSQWFEPPHRRAVELKRIPASRLPESTGTSYRGALWLRPSVQHAEPDARVRRAVFALCSDFTILEVIVLGHGLTFADPRLTVASLDHSFWWHGDPVLDDWLLFVQESPWAGDQRGLVVGHIYDREGVLRGSTTQEGLVRFDDSAG